MRARAVLTYKGEAPKIDELRTYPRTTVHAWQKQNKISLHIPGYDEDKVGHLVSAVVNLGDYTLPMRNQSQRQK